MGNCCQIRDNKANRLYVRLEKEGPKIKESIKAAVISHTKPGEPLQYEDYNQVVIHIFAVNHANLPPDGEIRDRFDRHAEHLKGRTDPEGYTDLIYKLLEEAAEREKRADSLNTKGKKGDVPANFEETNVA